MGRTIYTAKKAIELHGAYKCSKCNKINYFEHTIDEKITESKYGSWHTKKTNEKMLSDVSEQAETAMSLRIMQIIQESKEKKYLSADFKGRCQYCGNYEPWQRMHYRFFDKIIFEIILPYSIIFSLILLFCQEFTAFLILTIIECVIGFSYSIIKKTNIKKREKEISILNEESLPSLFWEDKMLFNYMEKNDPEALKAFLEKKVEEENSDFCIVCGAMLKENQETCHVCGQQKGNN